MSRSRGGHMTMIAAALCVAAVALLAACGQEEETEVVEGEPVELGDLKLNVQLTRFLNPKDNEDVQYLEGQPAPAPGEDYLGVFIEIKNESDKPVPLPTAEQVTVIDTTDAKYMPLPPSTDFAVPIGESVAGDSEIPELDTASASGPIQASLLIFRVSEDVSENRPLELEVEGAGGEQATIELDI